MKSFKISSPTKKFFKSSTARLGMSDSGFTLIELMVSVGIVGVLASVAVPNYNKYSVKARQTEAKVGLGSIYTAEQTYSIDTGGFTACLSNIGFTTSANYYAIGFNASTSGGTTYGSGSTCTLGVNVSFWSSTKAAGGATLNSPSTAGSVGTTPPSFFTAAEGKVGGSINDIWTIDSNRNLSNSQPAI